MARLRMVTRTILGTKASAVCMDMTSLSAVTKEFIINAKYEDDEKLLKSLKKQYETATLKIVALQSAEGIEKCYGMLESEFLKYAKELDPETRKSLEE